MPLLFEHGVSNELLDTLDLIAARAAESAFFTHHTLRVGRCRENKGSNRFILCIKERRESRFFRIIISRNDRLLLSVDNMLHVPELRSKPEEYAAGERKLLVTIHDSRLSKIAREEFDRFARHIMATAEYVRPVIRAGA